MKESLGPVHAIVHLWRSSLPRVVSLLQTLPGGEIVMTLMRTVCIAFLLFAEAVFAGSWISGAGEGVAIQGYDTVAYYTQKRAVKGSSSYKHEWAGTVWHFASDENRLLFVASPEKYAPEYGGHCALSMASGRIGRGAGDSWTVRNGKLYLNGNNQAVSQWFRDPSGNIEYADKAWPAIKAALEAR